MALINKYVLTVFILIYGITICMAQKQNAVLELRKPKENLIHPLLDCYAFSSSTIRAMKNMEDSIKAYINTEQLKKNAKQISVYYRSLNNGPWIGVNENEQYCPASLLKLPFLIAALKQEQNEPGFLDKKVEYYQAEKIYKRNIGDTLYLQYGEYYTIYQLIEEMVIHSDNDAMLIVVNNIWSNVFEDVFYDLDIDINSYAPDDRYISPKIYASYYRILYNATYLNERLSNLALNILTKSTYKSGILAGLPPKIVSAHKYGERTYENQNELELHDSAIVYDADQPYLLCIMTRGTDFKKLTKIISTLSAKIYKLNKIKK